MTQQNQNRIVGVLNAVQDKTKNHWGYQQLYKTQHLFLARLQVFVLRPKSFPSKQGSY
jgi:hypothetical protein